ncbi:MAG TPA: hypothetical protein PLI53_00235 [Geobacteraceae bacterium]|nr:hypothetical protein [Geobacteraceae bacterium]
MKRLFAVSFGLFLFAVAACAAASATKTGARSDEQLSPEVLVEQAEAKYAEYLAAHDGDRSAATEKTAGYLRGLPEVKEVTVRGSDSLFVIMRDGNELLLMLGKDRL